jgi:hypothetical protein
MFRASSTRSMQTLHDIYCSCNSSKCSIHKHILRTNAMLQLYLQTLQLDTLESQSSMEIRRPLQRLFQIFQQKCEEKCRTTQKERKNRLTSKKAHPNYCFFCSHVWNHVRRCHVCESKMYLCNKHELFFGRCQALACEACEEQHV